MLLKTSYSAFIVHCDDKFNEIIRNVFEKLDDHWNFIFEKDGKAGLSKLIETEVKYDLILTDISFTEISGIDFISATKKKFPSTPVLVISTIKDKEKFLAAIRAGAHGYLTRIYDEYVISDSINQIIQGEFPVCPSLTQHFLKIVGSPIFNHSPGNPQISPRESELLELIAQGYSYTQCSELMGISLSTVQTHIRNMYRKLNVSNHRQAINKMKKSETSYL